MVTFIPTVFSDRPSTTTPVTAAELAKIGNAIALVSPVTIPVSPADCGPTLQAIIDSGASPFFDGNATYRINSPVFFDKTSAYRRIHLSFRGCTVELGSGLPTAPAFFRDTTTQFAFFVNTLRSAWNTGTNVVDVSVPNRATGSGGSLMALSMQDVTFDGMATNTAVVFGNRTGLHFLRCTLLSARTMYTGFDYSDIVKYELCHNRKGGTLVTNTALGTHINNGDGITFDGCKADGTAGLYLGDLKLCRGATIFSDVTGKYKLDSCSAINFIGCHQESISNTTNILINDSAVDFWGCVFYQPRSATIGSVDITDNGAGSDVGFHSCYSNKLLSSSDSPVDNYFGPFLTITTGVAATSVAVDNMRSTNVTTGSSSTLGWQAAPQPFVTSGTTAIQTAITAGRATMASGNWVLTRHGGGTTWAVRPYGKASAVYEVELIGAGLLSMTATAGGTNLANGGLTASTLYSYCCSLEDEAGKTTAKSAEVTVTTGASDKTVMLRFDTPKSGLVTVFRKVGAGASTTPDRYWRYMMQGGVSFIWDTGTIMEGEALASSGIPTPPASNTTADGLWFKMSNRFAAT